MSENTQMVWHAIVQNRKARLKKHNLCLHGFLKAEKVTLFYWKEIEYWND